MSTPSAPAVVVDHLTKRYGPREVLRGVSFEVLPGEVFGLLGPNGAGKTTTLRILTGRARPTSGQVHVLGLDIVRQHDAVTTLINVVPEEPNLYERVTGYGNLRLFSDLYGLPPGRVEEVLDLVDLRWAAKQRVRTYSTGMRQRLLIARALLNRPRVLFLDEPTRGLDPLTARDARQLIARLSRDGTTILLATHILEEVDALCSRVAFLRGGQLVALASPRALKLAASSGAATVVLDDTDEQCVRLDDAEDARRLAGWMAQGRVRTIHSGEPSLEDVFVRLAHAPADETLMPAPELAVGEVHHRSGATLRTGLGSRLRRWWRVVGRLVQEEVGGTVRNGQWLLLTLLLALAASCGALHTTTQRAVVQVAYAPDQPTAVPERLMARVPTSIELALTPMSSAEDVRQAVDQQRAALGLVFPDHLDTALRAGQEPTITVIRPSALDGDAAAVVASVGPAVQDVAGRPGASLTEEVQPAATVGWPGAVDRLGALGVLASLAVLLLLILVGTMIVPSLLNEEVDKKTLAALLLVASPGQVVAGKGLTGLLYIAGLVPIAVLLSGLHPAEPLPIAVAVALLGMWLVEVGLVLGLVVERRTYETVGPLLAMWVLLLPVVVALAVGSGGLKSTQLVWPPTAAAWLLLDGLTGLELYLPAIWAILVLLGWVVATYLMLVAIIRRREL